MKQNNNTESGFFGRSISSSSIRNLLPRSLSSKHKSISSNPKTLKSDTENTPPANPNIHINNYHQTQPKTPISQNDAPESNASHDPPVKVVVRIRPENSNIGEGDCKFKKVSSDTLCVGDTRFTFDEVFDTNSNQEDVFQSVGVPLVRNLLAGYNTSILSCGQSGSGETYTMWGPLNAIAEEPSCHSHQGIVPRIFRMLFSELERNEHMSDRRQFNYQCRCSFIEIYSEQIGDLLNPTQRNLEMKDESKNASCIENLIEKYVTSYDDVAQILIKGLSSRKVGAARLNSNSFRSHIIFTFVIESWCKGTLKNSSSSKTSRINLIDLAGLYQDNVEDAGSQCLRERRNVNKPLSQLVHLVTALTKEYRSGNEDFAHRSSCLARLLQELLDGNAKLSVICSISPDNKSNGETLHTLRFGQRVRFIRNEPVINELKEADTDFGDTVRHLKEELIRAKADVHTVGSKCFQGPNVQESLNQLRVSLNRSLNLPHIDNVTDEEVIVNKDDIRQLRQQIDELYSSSEGNPKDISVSGDCVQFYSVEENCDADMTSGVENKKEEVCYGKTLSKPCHEDIVASRDNLVCTAKISRAIKSPLRHSISVRSCSQSPIFDGPQLSESPKFSNTQRKSVAISSGYLESWNNVAESSNFSKDVLGKSFKQGEHMQSNLQSSKAECLAASLQRGLQIIDCHLPNSALNKSSTSFSFEHLTLTPCPEIDNVKSFDQTIQLKPSSDEVTATLLCTSCRTKISNQDSTEVQDSLKSCIETVGKAGNADGLTDKVPKCLENAMERSITREELENVCTEQAARIEQLNQLVKKLKGEKELNSFIVYGQREDYYSMKDRDKLLMGTSSDGHLPYIMEENCEIKEVQEELAQRDSFFDATEKESLLKEIQNLSKLQSNSDAPVKKSTDRFKSLMSRSIQLQKSGIFSHDSGGEELENERQRWTEMESEWICLTDELRVDLESYRQHAERVEMELRLEKKCTAELDDALNRAVIGHSRMVEHYADLQEKYDDLVAEHHAMMQGIAEVKKAVAKASKKGHARFAKSLAAELSALRVERERESKLLKKENQSLKIQLRDTAEAVQAAGELLVRLREAEYAASVAEENFANVQEDNEKLKMQLEKLKGKHRTEIFTMKQYLTESKLPEPALQPLYREDSDAVQKNATSYTYDDQAWRAEFGTIYQEHYY